MEVIHQNAIINGLRIHYIEAGPSDRETVVLLHGFPEFWYGWRHQIEGLVDMRYHVVIPDQRGYNLSDKPGGVQAYHVDCLTSDLAGLLDHLGVEQAFIAGHDWGGIVAWDFSIQYPGRVKKLGILNAPHPDVMPGFVRSHFKQVLKSWYILFFNIPRLPEGILRFNRYWPLKQMVRASSRPGTFSEDDLKEYMQAWNQPGALTGMINWYRAALRSNRGQVFNAKPSNSRNVIPPTMIIWGKNDIALSSALAEESLALCQNGRLIFYEDSGHWVQHEKARSVTDDLVSFFYGSFP